MISVQAKSNNSLRKTNNISNLIQLKLVEFEPKQNTKINQAEKGFKISNSIINTPSSIDDFKQFHSC